MATRIRRLTLIYGKDDLKPPKTSRRSAPAPRRSFSTVPREDVNCAALIVRPGASVWRKDWLSK
jgi:hypothetical protein